MGTIVHVTDATVEAEIYQSQLPVLVDFWASWCGPCQVVEPTLEVLAKEYEKALKVVKVNVDENPEFTAKMRVLDIPALSLFYSGQLRATKNGVVSLSELRNFVDTNLYNDQR